MGKCILLLALSPNYLHRVYNIDNIHKILMKWIKFCVTCDIMLICLQAEVHVSILK